MILIVLIAAGARPRPGVVRADGEPARAAGGRVTVGGAACSGPNLDCADGRIATRWDLDALARDLPSARTAWSLLETLEPAAVTDRIEGAGLYPAEPARFAMRGASWTQNAVLVDGLDVTDPLRGGVPLALPEVDSLQTIEVTSALAPADIATPGVTLALVSRAPADAWRGTAQAFGLGSGLQSGAKSGDAPAIARFGSLVDASAFVSGPVSDRMGLLASVRVARVRRVERDEAGEREPRLVSSALQLEYRAGDRDSLRLGGWGQWLERPFAAAARFAGDPVSERADAFAATSTWTHEGDRASASAFAGLATGDFAPQAAGRPADAAVERLRDGPVPGLVFPSRSRRSSWSRGRSARLPGRAARRPRARASSGRERLAGVADRERGA